MKILYVTDTFAVWGGMERELADKMDILSDQYNNDVFLLTVNQGVHPLTYDFHPSVIHIDIGVRMHQQYQYRGLKRLGKRIELKRMLKRRIKNAIDYFSPDIIICVKFDFVGVLLDVKGKIPLIVESHTLCKSEFIDGSRCFRRLHVRFWKQKIRKVNAVVALTDGDAKEWEKINKNVCVIPNIVHLNNSKTYSTCQERSVIFVGRFSNQKDIGSLLKIWSFIYKNHPDWKLDIYGTGELKDFYLPSIYEIKANIHVYEPTAEIMDRYREHSILLLTSLYEPFGLVLPEAMSCGLPVVAFDCPYGPAEIITDGVDGFLIKNRDIQAFADRVCQLIEDEELRRRMGQNGIASSQRYRADVIMPKWINLFEKLLFSQ